MRRKADRRSTSPGPMASGFKEGDESGEEASEGAIPEALPWDLLVLQTRPSMTP